MKHTECKDCELSDGDCGYHFKMDGKTNYDIASLSACDRYGNCDFFKPKAKPQGDLISREALKEQFNGVPDSEDKDIALMLIDNAPTVEYTFEEAFQKTVCDQRLYCPERPQGEWIIDGHHRRCNYCNEYICTEDREGNSIPDSFCPNCGARMQKGD